MVQSYSPGGANVPSHVSTLAPMVNMIELVLFRPTRVHNTNGKSIVLVVSAQLIAESPYTWATLSLKIAPSYG